MSHFKFLEKEALENLFDGGGYVLDFSDRTFGYFFDDHNINIDDNKYHFNGTSKMNRLRTFWDNESDELVGKVLEELLEYALSKDLIPSEKRHYINQVRKTIARLQGEKISEEILFTSKQQFFNQEFPKINWGEIGVDAQLQEILKQRVDEIQKTINAEAPISVIFLCGSTLEGLLLDAAINNQQKFNQAKSAPKDKTNKVKSIHEWTLKDLINVAYEVNLITLDVKQHSHSLRDFRNYIHPREQVSKRFTPDMHTAKISWQVLQAVIANLSASKK